MIYSVALMVPLVIFIGLGAVLATGASGSGGILATIGLGALLLILAGIGSMPWILRMAGGLFVDQYTWGRSFKLSFSGRHYWAIFGSMLLSMLVYSLVLALMLLLINLLGVLGIVLYGCLYFVLGVVAPIWFFALYTATRDA